MGFFEKIKQGLKRTTENIGHSFDQLFAGELNDDFYDELEETLILSDMGVDTALEVVDVLRAQAKEKGFKDAASAREALQGIIARMLLVGDGVLDLSEPPAVVLFIGVNGVGKTTTIGKLAARLKDEGKKVLLCAGDTFRAAAADQLTIWSSAPEWTSSVSTRGRTLPPWCSTLSPPQKPGAVTPYWWTPRGGSTTSRI